MKWIEIILKPLLGGRPKMTFDPHPRLGSQAHYGDTSVRTLGALVEKVCTCLNTTATYGLTREQLRGLMAPNEAIDVDRAISVLQGQGRAMAVEAAGREYFFENTPDARRRAQVSLARIAG